MWFTRCTRSHPELCLFLSSGGVRSLSSGRSVCNLVNHCYSVFSLTTSARVKVAPVLLEDNGPLCEHRVLSSGTILECAFTFWADTKGKWEKLRAVLFAHSVSRRNWKGWKGCENKKNRGTWLTTWYPLICLSFLHAFNLIYWATGNVWIIYSIPVYRYIPLYTANSLIRIMAVIFFLCAHAPWNN